MKLYDFGPAANAQRVRVFLAEKGLQVPTVEVNVREGQLYEAPYAAMNPFHCVPFLELDDGRVIAESISICRYLEELHPEPPLFGRDPAERATVDMWNRRIELDGFLPGLHAVRNLAAGNLDAMGETLELLIERDAELLSAALRRADGSPLVETDEHVGYWIPIESGYSSDAQISVPRPPAAFSSKSHKVV